MQQTETYKFNKPEMSDTFSAAPLCENADKMEAALLETAAKHTALEQRVINLENCRVVIGTYNGTRVNAGVSGRIIDLGERPVAVLVSNYYVGSAAATSFVAGDYTITGNSYAQLRLTDNGFWVDFSFNQIGVFSFLALMGDWDTVDIPKPTT